MCVVVMVVEDRSGGVVFAAASVIRCWPVCPFVRVAGLVRLQLVRHSAMRGIPRQ